MLGLNAEAPGSVEFSVAYVLQNNVYDGVSMTAAQP